MSHKLCQPGFKPHIEILRDSIECYVENSRNSTSKSDVDGGGKFCEVHEDMLGIMLDEGYTEACSSV